MEREKVRRERERLKESIALEPGIDGGAEDVEAVERTGRWSATALTTGREDFGRGTYALSIVAMSPAKVARK